MVTKFQRLQKEKAQNVERLVKGASAELSDVVCTNPIKKIINARISAFYPEHLCVLAKSS